MLCRALGALGRASRGGIRLAPSAAPLRSALPAATGTAHHGRELAVLVANVVCEEQPRNCVLPLLAAGSVAAILMPDTSDCMGKRKKKGTEEADEMYEVDHIVASRLVEGGRQSTSFAGRAMTRRVTPGSHCPICAGSSQTWLNSMLVRRESNLQARARRAPPYLGRYNSACGDCDLRHLRSHSAAD